MIDLNDLKRGNLVEFSIFKNGFHSVRLGRVTCINLSTITVISGGNSFTVKVKNARPIPITNDILDKAKFKGRVSFKWNGNVGIQTIDGEYYFAFKDLGNVVFHSLVKVKYLQTIQNMYKLLNGKELEVEL